MLKNHIPNTSAFYLLLALQVDSWLSLRRVEGVDLVDYDAPAPFRDLSSILCSECPGFHYPISNGVATT